MSHTLVAFTENYRMGGGNRYLVDFLECAASRFERTVVVANPGGVFPGDVAAFPPGTEVREVPVLTAAAIAHRGGRWAGTLSKAVRMADPVAFSGNTRRLEAVFRDLRADVVVAFNGGYPAARSSLAAAVAARRAGAAAVLSVVGTPVPRRPRLETYEARLDASVWSACSAVAVNAQAIGSSLESLRGAPAEKLKVVRNGLPDTEFVRDPSAEAAAPVIGCVSRVDAEKGALDLFEAFTLIAPEFPSSRLRLVGEGDARDEIARRASAAGLSDRVELPGRIEGDAARIVAEFDVFAFASHHEGFPYAVLEAMRAGCAIVTTGVGGIPEAVGDGVEGLVVGPRDAEALAGALRATLSDARSREQRCRAARARFLRDFSLKAMCGSVSGLLDCL